MRRTVPPLAVLTILTFVPACLFADAKDDQQKKRTAELAAKFEYPRGKRLSDYNIGSAYQSVATTSDHSAALATSSRTLSQRSAPSGPSAISTCS